MTDIPVELREVTQADRDAAVQYGYPHNDLIKSGQYDRHPAVQAFARHRLAALATTQAGVVGATKFKRFAIGSTVKVVKSTNFHKMGELVVVAGYDISDTRRMRPDWICLEGKPGHYSQEGFEAASDVDIALAATTQAPASYADLEGKAERIATEVADICHGDRKPTQAAARYAIIWQAAKMGAIRALASSPATEGVERECLTPESYYSFGWEDNGVGYSRTFTAKIRFPFDIGHWAGGTSGLVEGMDKLAMYEAREAEQKRISDLVHDQMEAVGADCYRVMREVGERIGKDIVDYGVAHARWRRTKQGDRPTPADLQPPPSEFLASSPATEGGK